MSTQPCYKFVAVWLTTIAAATACHDEGHHDGHHDHDHDDVPGDYRDLRNPLADDPGAAGRGLALYQRECADCHGDDARGDGPRAPSLRPPPSDLVELVLRPDITDGYLFWRISEGGEAQMTAMPAWVGTLDETEIWELISSLHARAHGAR